VNTVFHLVNPVLDRNMFIFKVTVFINGLNVNRIPYFSLRSAYSTCRKTEIKCAFAAEKGVLTMNTATIRFPVSKESLELLSFFVIRLPVTVELSYSFQASANSSRLRPINKKLEKREKCQRTAIRESGSVSIVRKRIFAMFIQKHGLHLDTIRRACYPEKQDEQALVSL